MSNRKVKSRKMHGQHGGKLLATGFESCVFAPPVPCLDGQDLPAKSVGKVLRNPRIMVPYDEEVNANAIVKRMDPEGKYSLPMITHCPVTYGDVKKAQNAGEKCTVPLAWSKSKKLRQLVYPHGGADLTQIMKTGLSWHEALDLIAKVGNVLLGVRMLVNHKYCHLDLKAENVLYDGQKMKIHDWSRLAPHSKIFDDGCRFCVVKKIKSHVFRGLHYDYHAPELKVFTSRSFLSNMIRSRNHGARDPVMRMQYIEFEKQLAKEKRSPEKIFSDFAAKLDVFSCGVIIEQLLHAPKGAPQVSLQPAIYAASMLSEALRDHNPYTRFTIDQAIRAHAQYVKILNKACIK